jgi:hypothetical protein
MWSHGLRVRPIPTTSYLPARMVCHPMRPTSPTHLHRRQSSIDHKSPSLLYRYIEKSRLACKLLLRPLHRISTILSTTLSRRHCSQTATLSLRTTNRHLQATPPTVISRNPHMRRRSVHLRLALVAQVEFFRISTPTQACWQIHSLYNNSTKVSQVKAMSPRSTSRRSRLIMRWASKRHKNPRHLLR